MSFYEALITERTLMTEALKVPTDKLSSSGEYYLSVACWEMPENMPAYHL